MTQSSLGEGTLKVEYRVASEEGGTEEVYEMAAKIAPVAFSDGLVGNVDGHCIPVDPAHFTPLRT